MSDRNDSILKLLTIDVKLKTNSKHIVFTKQLFYSNFKIDRRVGQWYICIRKNVIPKH